MNVTTKLALAPGVRVIGMAGVLMVKAVPLTVAPWTTRFLWRLGVMDTNFAALLPTATLPKPRFWGLTLWLRLRFWHRTMKAAVDRTNAIARCVWELFLNGRAFLAFVRAVPRGFGETLSPDPVSAVRSFWATAQHFGECIRSQFEPGQSVSTRCQKYTGVALRSVSMGNAVGILLKLNISPEVGQKMSFLAHN